jgi:hypothetical protein
MIAISHTSAFKAQSDFAPESKIKVGSDIWTPETAGARLYAEVLSKKPSTVQKAIDLAAALDPAFTVKQVQGHLRWLYTAGQLTVDDKTYIVPAKEPKVAKAPTAKEPAKETKGKFKPKVKAKAEAKTQEAKTAALRQHVHVKTKKLTRAA